MRTPESLGIEVAVVAERRPAATRWADWTWRAVEVLETAPDLPPWSVLREEGGVTLFLAGRATVWLHPTDTDNYKHNMEGGSPRIWVVLRETAAAPGMSLATVTVDGGEAHLYGDAGADLLESLPMPGFLHGTVADFIARHHIDRAFHKRKRDRANPEAMARRAPAMDEE